MIKLTLPKPMAVLATVAFASSALAASEAEASQRYLMEMRISDGGAVVAEPRLEILSGMPAVIKLSDGEGPAYNITITAKPEAKSTVSFSSKIEINSPNENPRTAEPALIVGLDKTATIEFGDESKAQPIFRMDVRFKAIG